MVIQHNKIISYAKKNEIIIDLKDINSLVFFDNDQALISHKDTLNVINFDKGAVRKILDKKNLPKKKYTLIYHHFLM